MSLTDEVNNRRTFAIISHPDAGKTTLTEKLLLYGGAIHLAGSVKARKTAKHAVSDWMEIEKQRGISVTSSVLQFDYEGHHINILDTPGHQDFSEDTYRTLMAPTAPSCSSTSPKASKPRPRNYSASVKNGASPSLPLSIKSTTSAATPSTSWMKSKTSSASTPTP